jgi:hypothetical protein
MTITIAAIFYRGMHPHTNYLKAPIYQWGLLNRNFLRLSDCFFQWIKNRRTIQLYTQLLIGNIRTGAMPVGFIDVVILFIFNEF